MTRPRSGFTMIELMAVILLISVLIALLLPSVQSAREAARRAQCANNLMQLGVALQSYETSHRVLPPGVVDRTGPVVESPTAYQYSWISQILHFLEANSIYRQLDFQTGVYSPANQSARSTTLGVLLCPSDSRGGRSGTTPFGGGFLTIGDPALTNYAACHHDVEAPIDATNSGVFFLNSRTRPDDIEDGLSHTIFLGEKTHPGDELGWASGTRATLRNTGTPIDRTVLDPSESFSRITGMGTDEMVEPGVNHPSGPASVNPGPLPLPGSPLHVGGFGSRHPGGANFVFGDGSVRNLRPTIDGRVYRLLGSRSDGTPIGDDQF